MATATATKTAPTTHEDLVSQMLGELPQGILWAGPYSDSAAVGALKATIGRHIKALYSLGEAGKEQLFRVAEHCQMPHIASDAWDGYRTLLKNQSVVADKKAICGRVAAAERKHKEVGERLETLTAEHSVAVDELCTARRNLERLRQAEAAIANVPGYLRGCEK